ncbi:MAG: DUF1343 domain-containing protein [Bacteroidales bacterium]
MKIFKRLFALSLLIVATLSANASDVIVGAASTDEYIPLLKGEKVAILSNHTGMVGDKHTLDIMLEKGVEVTTIFSPEHGFRGDADAGEHVSSGVDSKTGIPIASLYDGDTKMPAQKTMDNFDVLVVDIQDVGLRFYTYYITMINLIDASILHDKSVIVLDRPNPNGMYVDGPILDMKKYKSGVGGLPIPVVHSLTMGEIAYMANEKGWLVDGKKADLTVIKCKNYTHQTRYELPIAPSPNLPNMKSIYLYPSTCYFEATPVSLGRGTDKPFQVYGHPNMLGYDFSFTPRSISGAKFPPQLDKTCYGVDLTCLEDEDIITRGINMEYVIDAYNNLNLDDHFFRSFFELLIGNGEIRKMIKNGKSAAEIEATWKDDVAKFTEERKPYLLYAE